MVGAKAFFTAAAVPARAPVARDEPSVAYLATWKTLSQPGLNSGERSEIVPRKTYPASDEAG